MSEKSRHNLKPVHFDLMDFLGFPRAIRHASASPYFFQHYIEPIPGLVLVSGVVNLAAWLPFLDGGKPKQDKCLSFSVRFFVIV